MKKICKKIAFRDHLAAFYQCLGSMPLWLVLPQDVILGSPYKLVEVENSWALERDGGNAQISLFQLSCSRIS